MAEQSADGVLTVHPSPRHGLAIVITWSDPTVWRTTITRTNDSTGDTVTVRSGDLAYTPGGYGVAVDNELPLSGFFTYQATGWTAAGALAATSDPVLVEVTEPRVTPTAWLKSVDNPHLNHQVVIARQLGQKWERDTQVFWAEAPADARVAYPVVWQSPGRRAFSGTLRLRLETADDWAAVDALSASGVLFLATSSHYAEFQDAFYLTVSGGGLERLRGRGWKRRWVEMPWQEVARPPTAGSPLRIPGWSYDDLAVRVADYDAIPGEWGTYLDLARDA